MPLCGRKTNRNKMRKHLTTLFFLSVIVPAGIFAQQAPAIEQNFPYLVTFGNKADKSWGDDDFVQTFFFSVPQSCNQAVYIRVYDPDIGGKVDEINTAMKGLNMANIFLFQSSVNDLGRQLERMRNFNENMEKLSKLTGDLTKLRHCI